MKVTEVIRNEGERGLLAWKYPSEELASWSQLTVRQGEEAVLFASGVAADRFGAGRYTLRTANLPLLGGLIRLPFGGKSPFSAELWYVSIAETLDIKWGTDLPINLAGGGDMPTALRGYGQLGIRVADAGLFVAALRGSVECFDKKTLSAYFRERLAAAIRESIAECYGKTGAEFFEKTETRKLLAGQIQLRIAPILTQYGMEPSGFIVSDLCASGQEDAEVRQRTFSVLSLVIPPSASAVRCPPQAVPPPPRRAPVAAAFILLALLLVVFCLLLPPRQTADFVGIAFAAAAHCLVTALAVRLITERHGLLVTVGFTVTAALYWLGAVGVALVFRVLSIADSVLLTALQLGMACVAALALVGFWYGRAHDPTEMKNEEADLDEADFNEVREEEEC